MASSTLKNHFAWVQWSNFEGETLQRPIIDNGPDVALWRQQALQPRPTHVSTRASPSLPISHRPGGSVVIKSKISGHLLVGLPQNSMHSFSATLGLCYSSYYTCTPETVVVCWQICCIAKPSYIESPMCTLYDFDFQGHQAGKRAQLLWINGVMFYPSHR